MNLEGGGGNAGLLSGYVFVGGSGGAWERGAGTWSLDPYESSEAYKLHALTHIQSFWLAWPWFYTTAFLSLATKKLQKISGDFDCAVWFDVIPSFSELLQVSGGIHEGKRSMNSAKHVLEISDSSFTACVVSFPNMCTIVHTYILYFCLYCWW